MAMLNNQVYIYIYICVDHTTILVGQKKLPVAVADLSYNIIFRSRSGQIIRYKELPSKWHGSY